MWSAAPPASLKVSISHSQGPASYDFPCPLNEAQEITRGARLASGLSSFPLVTPDLWPSNTARFPGGREPRKRGSSRHPHGPRTRQIPSAQSAHKGPDPHGNGTGRRAPRVPSDSHAGPPTATPKTAGATLPQPLPRPAQPGTETAGPAPDPRGARQVSTHRWEVNAPQGSPRPQSRLLLAGRQPSMCPRAAPSRRLSLEVGGQLLGRLAQPLLLSRPPALAHRQMHRRGEAPHHPDTWGGASSPPRPATQRLRCEWEQVRPRSRRVPRAVLAPLSARALPTASDSAATQHGLHN